MSQLQKRKALMEKANQMKYVKLVVEEKLIQHHLQSEVKEAVNNETFILNEEKFYKEVQGLSPDEILNLLEKQFDETKKDELFDSCKQTMLENIIKPFGLGAVLFSSSDKDGGNVTTLHNFEKGVTATVEDEKRYTEYKEKAFERKAYEGKAFKEKRKDYMQQEGTLKDAYTGKEISKDGQSHLDHIVSAHEIHKDAKNHLYMSENERTNMAINDQNLAMTNGSLNQSKSDRKMEDFLNDQKRGETQQNAERYGINREAALKKDQDARVYIKQTQLKQQLKKQGKELTKTSALEGTKMGVQQALGAMLYDFVEAAFTEVKEFVKYDVKDIKNEGVISKLKERLEHIAHKILSKWQHYMNVFKEGFLSGILSNIITFIVNTFMTTLKRYTRVIREGFFIFVRAVRMIVSPPPGMTKAMVYDAALKLAAGAVVTTVGILGAEALAGVIGPIPFGNLVANVIAGLLIGLVTCGVMYLLEKMDFFNVNKEVKHQFIVDQLTKYEEEAAKRSDYHYTKAMESANNIMI